MRLHLASTRPELRSTSIQAVVSYVEGAHGLFPNLRHINMHAAPCRFPDPPIRPGVGPVPRLRPDLASWDLLVEAVRLISRRCLELGLSLSVENNWAYWDGIDPETPPEQCDPEGFVEYFCTLPQQWLRLAADVNEPNFSMCLDPSHATPCAHRWPPAQRSQVLLQYLSDPSKLGHLHWNDSDMVNVRGRNDLHLPVGTGNLGDAFHRTLKKWAADPGHIALLEHYVDRPVLEKELAYITSL